MKRDDDYRIEMWLQLTNEGVRYCRRLVRHGPIAVFGSVYRAYGPRNAVGIELEADNDNSNDEPNQALKDLMDNPSPWD